MALDDNNTGFYMPVAPANGGNGFGNGLGGDGWWILLLLLFAGGGFGGGFGGNSNIYPWMNQSNQIGDGFRDQMLNTTINGIQNSVTAGFGGVENSLCAGFAGVNASINNTQMANLERSFAAQTANTAAISGSLLSSHSAVVITVSQHARRRTLSQPRAQQHASLSRSRHRRSLTRCVSRRLML